LTSRRAPRASDGGSSGVRGRGTNPGNTDGADAYN
jgi:hypothetical protein